MKTVKFISAMLSVLLIFGLTACGADTGVSEENTDIAEQIIFATDEYLNGHAGAKETYDAVKTLIDSLSEQKSDDYEDLYYAILGLSNELFIEYDSSRSQSFSRVATNRNNVAELLGIEDYPYLMPEDVSTPFGDLFDICFVYFAKNGIEATTSITYEDALSYFDNSDYAYETVGKFDSTQMCQITVGDANGFELSIFFYPEDDDDIYFSDYTVTSVTYSDGNFGCCATDMLHMTTPSYERYDATADDPVIKISGPGMIQFMENECWNHMAEYY